MKKTKGDWRDHSIRTLEFDYTNAPQKVKDAYDNGDKIVQFLFDSRITTYYVSDKGKFYTNKNNELKRSLTNSGYIRFNGICAHRVVAYCFGLLKDLNDHSVDIDHIDKNKTNCAVSNLRVLTQIKNCETREGISKKIDCYDVKTLKLVATYDSIKQAASILNIYGPAICNNLKGKSITYKGFVFKYHGDELVIRDRKKYKMRESDKRIKYKYIIMKDGEVVQECYSLRATEKYVGGNNCKSDIRRCLAGKRSTVKGYTFKREEINNGV